MKLDWSTDCDDHWKSEYKHHNGVVFFAEISRHLATPPTYMLTVSQGRMEIRMSYHLDPEKAKEQALESIEVACAAWPAKVKEDAAAKV